MTILLQGSSNATAIFLGEILAYLETFEPDIMSVSCRVGSGGHLKGTNLSNAVVNVIQDVYV